MEPNTKIKLNTKIAILFLMPFVMIFACGGGGAKHKIDSEDSVVSVIKENLANKKTPFVFKFFSKEGGQEKNIRGGANVSSDKDVFLVGSITKVFTATLILELHSKGLLNIDDPVNKYIKDYPFADDIKIRNLLNHTSGLRDSEEELAYLAYTNPYKKLSLKEVVDVSTKFTDSREYKYSNTGFLMLGKIIEIVTGQSYNAYLDKQIIQRLNLKHTCMIGFHKKCSPVKGYVNFKMFEGLDDSQKANIDMSKGYGQLESYDAFVSIAGSAGGLASNIDDLEKFINHLKSDYFFDFDLMIEGSGEYRNGLFDYGNGIYGHSAGTVDSSAILIFSRKKNQFFFFNVGDVTFDINIVVGMISSFSKK